MEGVITSNIRDKYTAGGREEILYKKVKYNVPKIIKKLADSLDTIKVMLQEIQIEDLEEYWGAHVDATAVYEQWCDLVAASATEITDFPLRDYLRE